MERNKFEKQLREQLQGREIKPTEKAWDRISRQLEDSEKQESVGRPAGAERFQWYGIAAGLVGVLFVSVLYFTNRAPTTGTEIKMTDVIKDSTLRNTSPATMHKKMLPDDTVVGIASGKEKVPEDDAIVGTGVGEEKAIKSAFQGHSGASLPDDHANETVAPSKNEPLTSVHEVSAPFYATEKIIHNKIVEVVARVEVLEKENAAVTDVEIDSLLRSAQRQILENEVFRKDRSVDAMALLAGVENELDQSFRDQLFEALKGGFLKVRTAVADRNK